MRSRSFVSSPVAVATAIRTRASVCGSRLKLLLRAPCSSIVSPRQPPRNTHLPHHLAARVRQRPPEQSLRLWLEAQLCEYRRNRQRRREAVSVLDLERHPESFAQQQGTVDALRADLGDDASRVGPHHVRARPPLTGEELRVHDHGFKNAELGSRNAE